MGCVQDIYRGDFTSIFSGPGKEFYFQDVVPIKYSHYLKEYEYEKNLPSIRERISKLDNIYPKNDPKILIIENSQIKSRITGKKYVCKSINYYSKETENLILKEIELLARLVSKILIKFAKK